MPYASEAQRRFMYSQHPEIAKKWDKEYPKQGKLPKHIKKDASKSFKTTANEDLGKAIARGMSHETARHERNMAIAAKRKESTLENAAERMFNQNFS